MITAYLQHIYSTSTVYAQDMELMFNEHVTACNWHRQARHIKRSDKTSPLWFDASMSWRTATRFDVHFMRHSFVPRAFCPVSMRCIFVSHAFAHVPLSCIQSPQVSCLCVLFGPWTGYVRSCKMEIYTLSTGLTIWPTDKQNTIRFLYVGPIRRCVTGAVLSLLKT